MKQKILGIVIFSGLFIFTGCAIMNKSTQASNPALLEPQSVSKFSDIPAPSGFKLIPAESYSFETLGVRVAMLKYRGKANPDQVVNFYKEQMMMYNWNLLNSIEFGQRLLNFDREAETCIVSLSGKGNSVTITISLGPKSQQSPKKSNKPLK